jgi:hypothetical protein
MKLQPKEPIVFVDKAGKPWSLRNGYDVSVFFPPQQLLRGRPTWLSLGGLRALLRQGTGATSIVPVPGPGTLCR